ncbi:hypothetical protein [Aureibaculum luteum]|uniref:hypothetical protein n=1 Tax=Aureibaculum luteum TaxID=1548456 RepID=UPI000E50BE2B|nr:hypothetical protein [Aureibaculum luteum]
MKNLETKNKSLIGNKKPMRRNLVIGGFMALLTVGAFAQNNKRGFNRSDMTPDQMAELQTKKMALNLDLTDAQQKKVYDLNKEQAIVRDAKRKEMQALREKGEKPANRNSYDKQKSRLDAQLVRQESMKKILNEDQYETWKTTMKRKGDKMKKQGKRNMNNQNSKGNRVNKRSNNN